MLTVQCISPTSEGESEPESGERLARVPDRYQGKNTHRERERDANKKRGGGPRERQGPGAGGGSRQRGPPPLASLGWLARTEQSRPEWPIGRVPLGHFAAPPPSQPEQMIKSIMWGSASLFIEHNIVQRLVYVQEFLLRVALKHIGKVRKDKRNPPPFYFLFSRRGGRRG